MDADVSLGQGKGVTRTAQGGSWLKWMKIAAPVDSGKRT